MRLIYERVNGNSKLGNISANIKKLWRSKATTNFIHIHVNSCTNPIHQSCKSHHRFNTNDLNPS